ncbi:MAG: patatin-like phospholipase family protein [Inquilinus sp.]|uniref:patatin-like phospholipase family protein n=1 Tax=Inquilinus sp. TaxID=1932117 RepID=UPI003F408751
MPDETSTPAPAAVHRPPAASPRRSARPPFDRIALLLQGGGALGSYQAGVYEALAKAGLHPDWVAGISIGAREVVHDYLATPHQPTVKGRVYDYAA